MSETGPEIRLAWPADEPAVRSCVDAAYAPYLDRMPHPPAPMLDDYSRLISEGVVFVAETGDEIVGLIVMWAKPDHLYVDNVAVRPTAQGQGTGRRLLDHAADVARATDRDELRLYTNEAMTENLRFYADLGFTETHRAVGDGYARVYFSKSI